MHTILEQLQTEFHRDAEALATLQNIYAEKVKQIRANRAFPPDIQQRFLSEWEQFYDQRVAELFNYNSERVKYDTVAPESHADASAPVAEYGIETVERRPGK